jgi:hypothetical protein
MKRYLSSRQELTRTVLIFLLPSRPTMLLVGTLQAGSADQALSRIESGNKGRRKITE